MGKNHFPPPESSPRSNKPPRRLAPGNQRVEAKPLNQTHLNYPPNRPPPDRFHGNHLNKTTADYRRPPNGFAHDHHHHHVPVKYDQRDSERKDPSSSEVRFKLPENFYTKEGPSFLDVMKKPVPVAVIPNKIRTNAPSEFNRDVDQVVRKPIADAEFNRSTAAQNQFLNLNPNTYSRDRPDLPDANDSNLDLGLDLVQDLNQINRKIPEELPIMKESTGKENAWKSGSFVDVLKKPAPITLPQINDSVMVGTGISPMEKAAPATNAQSRNGYQNQTPRYYKRRDRGRRTVNLEKKHNRNRKAHHSRGEEILLDDSKKKIRTPEKVELPPADLPKSSDFIVGNVAILIRKYSNLL